MKQGELYRVRYPYEDSRDSKVRPAILVAGRSGMVAVVMVTSHKVRRNEPYDIELNDWSSANLKLPSVARASKTIVIDEKDLGKKIGELTAADRKRVVAACSRYVADIERVKRERRKTLDVQLAIAKDGVQREAMPPGGKERSRAKESYKDKER